jgi:hypothetical protein
MTGGIGTRGKVVDGVYTGELDGPFCYGEGKVDAIREIARFDGYDLGAVLRLQRLVERPADARAPSAIRWRSTPTPSSSATPAPTGWPVVIFSQRTKTVIRRTVAGVASTGLAVGTFAVGLEIGTRRSRRGLFG